jgi:hypothetical protein
MGGAAFYERGNLYQLEEIRAYLGMSNPLKSIITSRNWYKYFLRKNWKILFLRDCYTQVLNSLG